MKMDIKLSDEKSEIKTAVWCISAALRIDYQKMRARWKKMDPIEIPETTQPVPNPWFLWRTIHSKKRKALRWKAKPLSGHMPSILGNNLDTRKRIISFSYDVTAENRSKSIGQRSQRGRNPRRVFTFRGIEKRAGICYEKQKQRCRWLISVYYF